MSRSTLDAAGDGTTILTLDEISIGTLRPLQPVLDPVTERRNDRSLARLAEYLEADRAMARRAAGIPVERRRSALPHAG